jgi:hypothetical protein
MRQSSQNTDVLTFASTIGRLALAPLPGAVMLAGWVQPPLGTGALMVDVILVPYVAFFCYAATVVFVLPIVAVWAPWRRPGYLVAAIWGMLSAWCSAAMLSSVREFVRWEAMLGFGVAGCACGLFYSRLARPEGRRRF